MIMKKHVILTFIILLVSTFVWGQQVQPLLGSGTSSDPYHIDDEKEWEEFVKYVNDNASGGFIYSGKYIKLNVDLTATQSVGHSDSYFAGNFDGNGHTITLSMSGDENLALFGCVDGNNNTIEIKNLTVNGSITTTAQYAAGFISQIWNTIKITSCTSSVTINNTSTGGAMYSAGFVGLMHANSNVTCQYCVYDGSINAKKRTAAAGFIGYVSAGSSSTKKTSLSILESTQAYQTIVIGGEYKTFFQIANDATEDNTYINVGTNSSTCYYLRIEDDSWTNVDLSAYHKPLGKPADKTIPSNNISKKYTRGGNNYYVRYAKVSMPTVFSENPTMPIAPAPVVTYYGKELTYKTDYNYTINTATKKVIFNATGDDNGVYYGTNYAVSYSLVDISDWGKLYAALTTNTDKIKVLKLAQKEYKPASGDKRLKIEGRGAVYLYLNGGTLNRDLKGRDGVEEGSVMFIGRNANVTIYGDGVITGGNNVGSGGGIRCQGKLQVYDVTFINNEAHYLSEDDYGTGGGIFCSNSLKMVGGEMCFNKSHGGGGGINGTGTSFYVENVYFHDNYCNSKGGGIRVKVNGAIIKDCEIVDNELEEHESLESASDGGGIHNDGCNPLTVINCVIMRNNAYRWGGGVFSRVGNTYLEGCTIQQNTSSENGGGIYIHEGSLTLRNNGDKGSIVTENLSDNTGGVYVASGATFNVRGNVQIINNIGTSIRKNVFFVNTNGKLNVISGDLNTASRIGVSRNNAGDITSGLRTANETVKRCIASDNYKNYWVLRPKTGEVALAASFDWSKPSYEDEKFAYWRLAGSSTDYVTWVKKSNTYTVLAPIIIPSGYKYTASSITVSDDGHIFIEDGGELVCPTASVPVSILKNINAASKEDGRAVYGWNIISSPVTDVVMTGALANVNIVTANSEPYNFDLLYYDEPNHYWRSYNSNTSSAYYPDHTLKLATGYLYRNLKDFTIEFGGSSNYSSVDCVVTASSGIANVRGFNLIGNPYMHNIYKGRGTAIETDILNSGYYRLNSSGGWNVVPDKEPIHPCEGVLVQAKKGGHFDIVDTDAESKDLRYDNGNIKFIVSNSEYEDVAYVMFAQSTGLNKMEHINADIPMVYINYDDEDYAIATFGDAVKAFNLNFKAGTTGVYTLSYEAEGEFDYLHIIDRLAERDIDMIAEGSYTFVGTPRDMESRFIVRLQNQSDSENEDIFAYQSGSDIVVSGEGELQVFDVMGRLVMQKHVSGVEAVSLGKSGVYILRLNGNTQKIVIRG